MIADKMRLDKRQQAVERYFLRHFFVAFLFICRVRNYKLRFPHNMVITGLLHRFSNAGGLFSVQK